MAGTVVGQARHEAGHVHDAFVHAPSVSLPARGRPQDVEHGFVSPDPFRQVIDPRSAAQISPRETGERWIEGGLLGEEGALSC
jgi:hypothetical protein